MTGRWSFWRHRYLELRAQERQEFDAWRAAFPNPQQRLRLDHVRYLLQRAEEKMREAALREFAGVPGP